MVAAIRPDNINIALFVHVLGAMLLVGSLLTVATAVLMGWRREGEGVGLMRFGLRAVLIGVLPAYVIMRVGAQWVESREHLGDANFTWLDIGYLTSDIGAIVILISVVLAILGLRKLRTGGGVGLGRAAGVLCTILLAAYVVAVWAMSAKPD
jgi:hypothetical protein